MDTLSRDSGNSNNMMPIVGVVLGAAALLFSIALYVKISKTEKIVAAHSEEMPKIATLENEVRAASAKADSDMKNLRDGVQNALNQVGTEIGAMRAQVTKMEEAQKARAVAPGKAGGAPTGVRNSDGTYSIAPGDTVAKVAKKFGMRIDSIMAENPGLEPSRLRVGQKIRLPAK